MFFPMEGWVDVDLGDRGERGDSSVTEVLRS